MRRILFFSFLAFFVNTGVLFASAKKPGVKTSTSAALIELSTTPVGSAFVRHLAKESNQDVKVLAKMERLGFGRSEMVTLSLVSQKKGKSLRDLANERLKSPITLKTMAEREGFSYPELYAQARQLKKEIEKKGGENLPPPVFLPLSEANTPPQEATP